MRTSLLAFLLVCLTAAFTQAQTDRVGIGTTTPRAGLDVQHNDGIVATGEGPTRFQTIPGPGNVGNLPTGAGTRLLWIPAKAAFRAGQVAGSEWDYANIGYYSTALGYNTTASGYASTAMGERSTASGFASTAMGEQSTASAGWSIAGGDEAQATGLCAIALGHRVTASSRGGVALGTKVSTDGKEGSFVLGDRTPAVALNSSVENQFSARFVGGYRLFTYVNPEGVATIGVNLAPFSNAWSVISDSTKKEGFRPADGALFLRKIASMRLGSWNYRGQDAKTMRHYGPMAQDFFSAFGRDGVGTVGEETTINQADFDGVNLIAIQALIRENESLKSEVTELRRLLGQVVADVQALKTTPVAAVSTAAR